MNKPSMRRITAYAAAGLPELCPDRRGDSVAVWLCRGGVHDRDQCVGE